MKTSPIAIGLICLLISASPPCQAADLPKTIPSAPCRTAPTIDGVIGDEEWKDARALDFELAMVQVNPVAVVKKRACRLWVMNSTNALYLALRVPDETVNSTFSPLDMDFVMLAFCRGKDVSAGDDRKALGPGIYVDKHVLRPGKDEDDKQQDGLGGMTHDKGACSFEWAIPLDSGDDNDIRVKPGDKLRFNLVYFDGFRPELKNTQLGGVYGPDLNHAAKWGT